MGGGDVSPVENKFGERNPPYPKEKPSFSTPSRSYYVQRYSIVTIATFWVKGAEFTMRACSWSVALQTVREQGLESESELYTLVMH